MSSLRRRFGVALYSRRLSAELKAISNTETNGQAGKMVECFVVLSIISSGKSNRK